MTTFALPPRSSAFVVRTVPRSVLRALALALAVCALIGGGVALAASLGGSVAQPAQSQQPLLTSPTAR
jgi:hypothetical protein